MKIRVVVALMVLASLIVGVVVGAGGCRELTPPHRSTTESIERTEGVEEGIFGDAWGAVKDVIVATAAARALADTANKVRHLAEELAEIDEAELTDDEKLLLARFYEVYWGYEDSVTLWNLALEQEERAGEAVEGIVLYEDGEPMVERADVMVETYDLPLLTSEADGTIRYVPEDSVQRLWRFARARAQEWLVPVMEG